MSSTTRIGWLLGAFAAAPPSLAGAQPATPVGADFQVNTPTTGSAGFPSIAADRSGRFLVAWEQRVERTSIRARVFDAADLPAGPDRQVSDPASITYVPDAVSPRDGRFVVSWAGAPQRAAQERPTRSTAVSSTRPVRPWARPSC